MISLEPQELNLPSSKESYRKYYQKNRTKRIEAARLYKLNSVELRHRDMKSHLRYILGKARLRKWEFSITPEDVYDLWDKQQGLCAYSKLPLNNIANHLQLASLDRIDSSIGYTRSNIQLVCTAVNKMKQNFTEEQFLNFCELITNTKRKNTQN